MSKKIPFVTKEQLEKIVSQYPTPFHLYDEAGIRRTDAVVIQEVSCLYLRYAKAHARMKLAQAPGA